MHCPFKNIVFIGAGKLAFHLSQWMYSHGCNILQIVNRDVEKAAVIASAVDADYGNIESINLQGDIYMVALSDDAYEVVFKDLGMQGKLLAHTSGITPLNTLGSFTNRPAVFYPLQTFSMDRSPEMTGINLFFESADERDAIALEELAAFLEFIPHKINTRQRQALHLAATFACNFSNAMYAAAEDILKHNGLEFSLLLPLIRETALKVETMDPQAARTGPAVRGDKKTMGLHLEMLKDEKDLARLYRDISALINQMGNKSNDV